MGMSGCTIELKRSAAAGRRSPSLVLLLVVLCLLFLPACVGDNASCCTGMGPTLPLSNNRSCVLTLDKNYKENGYLWFWKLLPPCKDNLTCTAYKCTVAFSNGQTFVTYNRECTSTALLDDKWKGLQALYKSSSNASTISCTANIWSSAAGSLAPAGLGLAVAGLVYAVLTA
jgi:hypothetical protein